MSEKEKAYRKLIVLPVILFCLIAIPLYGGVPDRTAGFGLLRPQDGIKITDNMPVLSWEKVPCEKYIIWIDGIRMDSVEASRNWYIPFPMSYGTHRWHVVARGGGTDSYSDTLSFTIADRPLNPLPAEAVLLRHDWKVASSLVAGTNGSELSLPGGGSEGWKSTSLPATVLSVMVRNGLYPNPYIGLNNMKIPDLSDAFNEEYDLLQYSHIEGQNPWKQPFWFRKVFRLPAEFTGRNLWLTLGEINYRAEVWLNGQQLADTSEVVGMERSFRFPITSYVHTEGENVLAIAIFPPDHPGKPAPPPLTPLADPGTNMADGMISRDYTKWDVLGWDWIPAVRDRDMGITEEVYIFPTDGIEIQDLYVTSDLPLPDTSRALITISGALVNRTPVPVEGILQGIISGTDTEIILRDPFLAGPGETIEFVWDAGKFGELDLKEPDLWWPHGYGPASLYGLSVTAETGEGKMARSNLRFGIREVETYLGPKERVYRINGRDIYCKGGNWVLDMTLNWTASRYAQEIELTRKANLNMLRIWGPTGAPPEAFYEAADENGIMLWQDFLNDFWGTFRNTPGYRPSASLFKEATISITRKYRNHPSLVIWGSGNEGPNPREELITTTILPAFDGRDSRHYLKISNGDGLHGGGPYHTLEPGAYFTDPKLNGFSSEIGPSGVPVAESVLKFMPRLGESWMPGRFPLDGVWAYHDANDWPGRDLRKFSSYDNIIRTFYGPTDSTSLEGAIAYLNQCQLLNYDVYRASIDAISTQLWDNASGILLWKSNSAWPSMTWQIYDWYLQAHAGYYGLKKATAPVTVFLNRETREVEVLNAGSRPYNGITVAAALYDSTLTPVWSLSEQVELEDGLVLSMKELVPVTDELRFLKLSVTDRGGTLLADNFYWLHAHNNFQSLYELKEPELEIRELKPLKGTDPGYCFTLANLSDRLALMTQLRLTEPETGLELLPTYWSDNFLTLLPGEEKEIRCEVGDPNLPQRIHLEYRSYQMKSPRYLSIELNDSNKK